MSDDPKDPRFRPFRAASWALYLVVAVGFSSLVIFSVFKSVLSMTPGRPAFAGEVLTEAQCLANAKLLFTELEGRRKGLAEFPDITHADQAFLTFRVDWMTRKKALEAQCALEQRSQLRATFASLERVMDLYTTASVQFSGGVGPATDELKRQLDGKPN
ncbi:MAG: hypothetical protein U0228_11910 [Myxococcaceae bacterium]